MSPFFSTPSNIGPRATSLAGIVVKSSGLLLQAGKVSLSSRWDETVIDGTRLVRVVTPFEQGLLLVFTASWRFQARLLAYGPERCSFSSGSGECIRMQPSLLRR